MSSTSRQAIVPPARLSFAASGLICHTRLLIAAFFLAACAVPRPPPATAATEPVRTVHLVRHGWHSGLVLNVADLPDTSPLVRDFPAVEHIEIGWGDRDYYQAANPSAWTALRALFWPTPSALHVVGFRGTPRAYFPTSEILVLTLPQSGFDRLHARVRNSFEFDAAGNPVLLGPGLYGTSRFYASRESFHLFNTCNNWTDEVLREAGAEVALVMSIDTDRRW